MLELVGFLLWISSGIIVIFTIQLKVPFDYKVFRLLTVKTLIASAMLACTILSFVCGLLTDDSEEDVDGQPDWHESVRALNVVMSIFVMIVTLVGFFMSITATTYSKAIQFEPLAQAADERLEQHQARHSKWEETRKAWQKMHRRALIYGRQAVRVMATSLNKIVVYVFVSPLMWLIKGINVVFNEIVALMARRQRHS